MIDLLAGDNESSSGAAGAMLGLKLATNALLPPLGTSALVFALNTENILANGVAVDAGAMADSNTSAAEQSVTANAARNQDLLLNFGKL